MTTRQRWTIVCTVIGSGAVFLDGTIVNAALKHIGQELPASLVGVLEGQAYIVGGYLAVLAALNINFYFNSYHADPNSLVNDRYRIAQRSYDALTAQCRYVASLGPGYKVAIMGRTGQPYDATTTYYLMGAKADVVNVTNPDTDLSSLQPDSKGIVFVFFPGNEQYQPAVRDRWPGGTEGRVESKGRKLLFYTYVFYAPPEK
jgi:hypothetical protein